MPYTLDLRGTNGRRTLGWRSGEHTATSHGTMAKRRTDAERRARQCERLARLLRVLQIILGPGRHDAKTIAHELECSERTVFRDLQALAVAGVPWYFDESCQSYRVRPGFRFSALPLNEQAGTFQTSSDEASASTSQELTDLSIEAVRQLAVSLGRLEGILSVSEPPWATEITPADRTEPTRPAEKVPYYRDSD